MAKTKWKCLTDKDVFTSGDQFKGDHRKSKFYIPGKWQTYIGEDRSVAEYSSTMIFRRKVQA
jgi:hypothetical protein